MSDHLLVNVSLERITDHLGSCVCEKTKPRELGSALTLFSNSLTSIQEKREEETDHQIPFSITLSTDDAFNRRCLLITENRLAYIYSLGGRLFHAKNEALFLFKRRLSSKDHFLLSQSLHLQIIRANRSKCKR